MKLGSENFTIIDKDILKKLNDDRIAYIYDSLCLHYINARDKAAYYGAELDRKAGNITYDLNYHLELAKRDKMRFFEILNDLIGEHK